jgi:hypothetical protein
MPKLHAGGRFRSIGRLALVFALATVHACQSDRITASRHAANERPSFGQVDWCTAAIDDPGEDTPGFDGADLQDVRMICEEILLIGGWNTQACIDMSAYLLAGLLSGNLYFYQASDGTLGHSEWNPAVGPPDPDAYSGINFGSSQWRDRIGEILRHEYGHVHASSLSELWADTYEDDCM